MITCSLLVLIPFSSCGIADNEHKADITVGKGVNMKNTSLASRSEDRMIKDFKIGHTEKATFALG